MEYQSFTTLTECLNEIKSSAIVGRAVLILSEKTDCPKRWRNVQSVRFNGLLWEALTLDGYFNNSHIFEVRIMEKAKDAYDLLNKCL